MSLSNFASVVIAIVAVLGLAVAGFSWFFRRGGTEREMTIALGENTQATRELSTAFHSFRDGVVGELRDFDVRITRLEANPNGSTPAYRNSSTPGGHSPG